MCCNLLFNNFESFFVWDESSTSNATVTVIPSQDRVTVGSTVEDSVLRTVHTTHKVKTVQVDKSTGRHCGDIELTVYLANATLP